MDRKLSGFTLIEIIVVMAIMSIAASMVVPSIISTTNTKLVASARTVMADVLYVQSQASTNQTKYYIVFTAATGNSPAKYELQNSGFQTIARPSGATTATMGRSSAELPYAMLGTLTNGSPMTIGFDALGQPFQVIGGAESSPTVPIAIPLASPDGKYTMSLSVQPFTGEVTAQ